MRHLRRLSVWGAAAASTLLLAAIATQGETSSGRYAALFSSRDASVKTAQLASRRPPAPPFDAQAATQHLAEAVRGLTADNSRLTARVAMLERNINDVTGSVTRQIAAVKAQTADPWPADAVPVPLTPAVVASLVIPPMPAPIPFIAPSTAPARAAAKPKPEARLPALSPMAAIPPRYGVDVGSAVSIEVLRARWLGIRSAHGHLFEGLTATAVLREIPQSRRIELRLVVGPLATFEAAERLCAALEPFRLYCRPTLYDREHLALQ